MSVLFKGRRSSLPNAEGQKLYYVQLVNSCNIGMDEIAAKIELKSSLTQGDVLSVIRNLLQIMQDAFKDGKSVKLDGLGSWEDAQPSPTEVLDIVETQVLHLKITIIEERIKKLSLDLFNALEQNDINQYKALSQEKKQWTEMLRVAWEKMKG